MIIACPACATRYVVPDAAIGVDGRTVRCAKCKHSWHQDGPELDLAQFGEATAAPEPGVGAGAGSTAPANQAEAKPAADTAPTAPARPPEPSPASAVTPAEPARAANAPDPMEPQAAPGVKTGRDTQDRFDENASQFDYQPPFRPRRNPLKLWTAAGAVFAVLALASVLAINFAGLPDWFPGNRPTFAVGQPDLVLEFPEDQQDRRELPNGTEFFAATGTITNTGRETRDVPQLLIVLRDQRDTVVLDAVVTPPQDTLAPGESMTISEALVDVPKSARFAEIGWAPVYRGG